MSPDGSIDWFCVPRFDSPSIFAALLDPVHGGRWIIRCAGDDLGVQRTYLAETNVLATRFVRNGDPVVTVTDFLVYSRVNAFDASHTGHTLLRRVEAFGDCVVETAFQPRFDYARGGCEMTITDQGVRAASGTEWAEVAGGRADWRIDTHADGLPIARAELELRAGDERWFRLLTPGAERGPHHHLPPEELLDLTMRTWGRWSSRIDIDGPWRDAVVRSALVLKCLVYEPTGALVAAPTTSLPEDPGGVRNWDYRYAWIRDSAYVLECFLGIGHTREAETFIRWVNEVADRFGGPHELRPLYRVTGDEDVVEFELENLRGYRDSRPVRVGNAASTQLQLDIYGAAAQLSWLTVLHGGEVPATRWSTVSALVEAVRGRWREPDAGLWEIRASPRHHTFSKFQCWLAVDRAIRIGRDLGLDADYPGWQALADEIKDDVLTQAFDPELGSFVGYYGAKEVDASVLLLPLRGLLPPLDDRVASTVEVVRRELEVADGLLLRYRTDDGLPGREGAFLMCSFWLVELLARMQRLDEAEELFERLVSLSGPLGLFGEQIDPGTGAHLGNYPQGFTHMGLIAAAIAIEHERGSRRHPSRRGRP